MKKTVLFPILLVANLVFSQSEIDCGTIDQWSSAVSHYDHNDQVVEGGKVYKAKWWTSSRPSTDYSGIGITNKDKTWEFLGTCQEGSVGIEAPNSPFWEQDYAKTSIRSTNTGNLSVGLDFKEDATLQAPYYKMTVKGRTNIIGDDNAFSIWSTDKNGAVDDNFRQYVVVENKVYPNSGTSYGVIGSNAYNRRTYTTKGGTDLILQPNGGQVGIGTFTTSPSASLHVKGTTLLEGVTTINKLNLPGDLTVGNSLRIKGSDLVLGLDNNRSNGTKDKNRALVQGNSDQLIINYDGDFEGGVIVHGRGLVAKEICVNTSLTWCDYVFEDDYTLLPLGDLETFVNKNHHLPEIPAAKELEENGIKTSEMITLQMKKIEELTLYVIELQKQIDKLKQQ